MDQVTLKRQQDLRARNVSFASGLDTAQANAQKSEAAAEAAQVNLDYCYIKSPINGRVGLRNVDIGNLVGPSSSPLVTIQGLDPIYTDFTVAETDLGVSAEISRRAERESADLVARRKIRATHRVICILSTTPFSRVPEQ